MSGDEIGRLYLDDLGHRLAKLRANAERAMEQVDDEAFFRTGGAEENSISLIVKHLSGNLRSRWTGFLTSDGEKPDRDRDAEFEHREGDDRVALMASWKSSWEIAEETLRSLSRADLVRTVRIRGELHSVVAALNRQLAHTAYHTGQIVLLSRHHAGERWETLSIPRRRS